MPDFMATVALPFFSACATVGYIFCALMVVLSGSKPTDTLKRRKSHRTKFYVFVDSFPSLS